MWPWQWRSGSGSGRAKRTGQRTEDIGLNGRDINNNNKEEEEGPQCKSKCRAYNSKNTGMKDALIGGRFVDGWELGPCWHFKFQDIVNNTKGTLHVSKCKNKENELNLFYNRYIPHVQTMPPPPSPHLLPLSGSSQCSLSHWMGS